MSSDPKAWRGLYAIIDVEACGVRSPAEVASAVLAGGCAVLQLRAKRSSLAETRVLATELQALCRNARVPFVLNDFVELAAALDLDGIHLGQGDMPLSQARTIAAHAYLGLSTHSLEQARTAELAGADLIGFGPVFSTASKENPDPVVGTEQLTTLMAVARVPVVAIGGIDLTNVDYVARTGVPLIACIGAICKAADPRAAAAALHRAALR
jgi:thiamine-phosphate pyrophosphorylase